MTVARMVVGSMSNRLPSPEVPKVPTVLFLARDCSQLTKVFQPMTLLDSPIWILCSFVILQSADDDSTNCYDFYSSDLEPTQLGLHCSASSKLSFLEGDRREQL
jgi:hypothetical protein